MHEHKINVIAKTEAQGGGVGFDLICVNPSVCAAKGDCNIQAGWRGTGSEIIVSDSEFVVAEFAVDAEWVDTELWLVVEDGK
jgi:hypothetical protein